MNAVTKTKADEPNIFTRSTQITAREEILHLINRYAFTVDTGDLEGFASLYEHGSWAVEGAKPVKEKQEILDVLSNVIIYDDGTPRTKHLIMNVDLKIDEDQGTASGQRYVTVIQQTDKFPLQTIFSGYYFDDFECIDGAWCFRKTLVRYPLFGDMSAHLRMPLNDHFKISNIKEEVKS